MAKKKTLFFQELKTFQNIIQFDDDQSILDQLKNNWQKIIFKNSNPICLELGCGKGEYTVSLAQRYPDVNFIGIDIKGDRLNRGCKNTLNLGLKNVFFLRIEIQYLADFFGQDEVDEIWITFPDPHIRGKRRDNRLTHNKYLDIYSSVLKKNGQIHLKTDSKTFYEFTLFSLSQTESYHLVYNTPDLYKEKDINNDLIEIKTTYEKKYLEIGKPITYVNFIKC